MSLCLLFQVCDSGVSDMPTLYGKSTGPTGTELNYSAGNISDFLAASGSSSHQGSTKVLLIPLLSNVSNLCELFLRVYSCFLLLLLFVKSYEL